MVLEELKSMVAQNCPGYNSQFKNSLLDMSSMAASCEGCSNFKKGKCSVDYFDVIADIFSRN